MHAAPIDSRHRKSALIAIIAEGDRDDRSRRQNVLCALPIDALLLVLVVGCVVLEFPFAGYASGPDEYLAKGRALARRSSAEHLVATKALRCTATAWTLIAAESSD